MPFNITTRLLSFVSGGLGILLLASVVFGWVQTKRLASSELALTSAKELIATLQSNAELYVQRINSDRQLIASRDTLIAKQNQAVLAMHQAAERDRAAYQARIAAAEKLAATYRGQASTIMSRQATTQNELERSREALRLIQEVIGQEKQLVRP